MAGFTQMQIVVEFFGEFVVVDELGVVRLLLG
jgi:hypothetical protein